MKFNKFVAILLALVVAIGAVTGCNNSKTTEEITENTEVTQETTQETSAPIQTDEEETPVTLEGCSELPIQETLDEDDTVVVYSWNDDISSLISTYSDANCEYHVFSEAEYYEQLDAAFASGNAPDLFMCDSEHATAYARSAQALAINDLGISNSEVATMFDSSLRIAADADGVIRGLAYEVNPCGVYYNRTLAEEYLGTSDPTAVAEYFSSWDSFLQTANDISLASEGEVLITSDASQLEQAFLSSRTTPWVSDGATAMDSAMQDYLELERTLIDSELTYNVATGTTEWASLMTNDQVLAYYGTLSEIRGVFEANTSSEAQWSLIDAPVSYCEGGEWMMASSTCNMRASCAKIMRDIALDTEALESMASNGFFANSSTVMNELASDVTNTYDWLAGQNPIVILLDNAITSSSDMYCEYEATAMDVFDVIEQSYINNEITTTDEAATTFEAILEETIGLV